MYVKHYLKLIKTLFSFILLSLQMKQCLLLVMREMNQLFVVEVKKYVSDVLGQKQEGDEKKKNSGDDTTTTTTQTALAYMVHLLTHLVLRTWTRLNYFLSHTTNMMTLCC